MKSHLCDSNVWLALALDYHPHHVASRRWFDGVDDAGSVLFCRSTQHSLARLLTTPAVFAPFGLTPMTNSAAWAAYDAFAADDRVALRVGEPAGLEARWRRYSTRDTASPKLWMDAYLAAFAVASGWRMVTTDGAFRQFDGVDLVLIG